MTITNAVITAASRRQRTLPLQTLINGDGEEKSVLSIIMEEVLRAGIDRVCVVVCPGDEEAFADAAGGHASRVTFVQQAEPRGYGHAILCARGFVADESFLHLVGDHLYVSQTDKGCAEILVQMAEAESCAISGVQPSHESLLPHYGCVGAKRIAGSPGLYAIEKVLEKPTPTEAEQSMVVSGLRAGYYLCFFGMHVLTPTIMDLLNEALQKAEPTQPITLSAALDQLARRERYLALESEGRRYDVGVKYGILSAQLALAMNGRDREEVLAILLQLLAQQEMDRGQA